MEGKELLYVLFWSATVALGLFFTGFGNGAFFLFFLSLAGTAFAEKMGGVHAAGAVFLAFAFAVYFGKTLLFATGIFAAALLMMLLPFILLGIRKALSKNKGTVGTEAAKK